MVTLGKALDIFSFFCVTTDLYANRIANLDAWIKERREHPDSDLPSLTKSVLLLPLYIILLIVGGLLLFGALMYCWQSLRDIIHIIGNGFDRAWLLAEHPTIKWKNNNLDYVKFIFVWILVPAAVIPGLIS